MSDPEDTLFKFPCAFPIKAIGKTQVDLDMIVVEIIRKHVSDIAEGAVKTKPSKQGKYSSVTVTITATSKPQLDAIYQDLTDNENVLMVF